MKKFDLKVEEQKNRHSFTSERDYQYFLAEKYFLDDKTYRVHEIVNIGFNALVVIGLFVLFLLSKISLITLLFALPIAYIAYDIIGLGLNRVVGGLHLTLTKLAIVGRLEKFSKLPPIEQKKALTTLKEKKWDIRERDYGAKLQLQAEIDTCKDIMENFKSVDDKLEEISINKNLSNIERAKKSISELEEYIDYCPKKFQNQYNSIIEKSKELLVSVEEKPNLMDKLNKTYNIYLKELIKLLDSYNELTEEEQKENRETLKVVMTHFLEHLNDLEMCLSAESKMSFDITSSVLLDNLKKEKNNV